MTFMQIETKSRKKDIILFSSTTIMALLASQLFNFFIFKSLPELQSWKVTNWFYLSHIRNHGGVFGILQGQSFLFSILSSVLLAFLVIYILKSTQVRTFEFACFGFILGGGLSNILDRLFYGSVIDYFDVRGIPHWHYIFNLADVMIHIGLWSMVLIGLFFARSHREARSPLEKIDQKDSV